MELIKQADLGQGWRAHLFDTGEMHIRNGSTGEVTWLPKKSVDTLISICNELVTAKKEETNGKQ